MLSEGQGEVADRVQRVKGLSQKIHSCQLKYDRAKDARAVFAFAYCHITEDLAKALEAQPSQFHDPDWVAELALAFGNRYLSAMSRLDAWLENRDSADLAAATTIYETVPKPWADVFLATRGNQSYVLEDLVFSMMAHISYDLPNALLEVRLDSHHLADYHLMNDVLARRINSLQAMVANRYQRFLLFLDRWTGSFDEFLTNYGIRVSRSVAWYNATRLLDPFSKKEATESIQRSTFLFMNSIRNPDVGWLRLLIRLARLLIPRRRRWPQVT